MIIEELESTTVESDNAVVTSVVETVLQQLVTHFNQEVHGDVFVMKKSDEHSTIPTSQHSESAMGDNDDDSINSREELTPTVKYWLNDVLPSFPTTDDLVHYLQLYETLVRPLLLEFVPDSSTSAAVPFFFGYVPTVIHYEMMFSEWTRKQRSLRNEERNKNKVESPMSGNGSSLYKNLELISTDITMLTSERYFSKLSADVRSHRVLPTLLRLQEHCLRLLKGITNVESLNDTTAHVAITESIDHLADSQEKALRRCIVSLLAFDDEYNEGCITPVHVAPIIIDSSQHTMENLCCFPPPSTSCVLDITPKDVETWNQALDLSSVDWKAVALSTSLWNDCINSITSRAANRVWNELKTLLQVLCKGETINDNDFAIRHSVIHHLGGLVPFYKDVRAHFFGRDMIDYQPATLIVQDVVLGKRVTKTTPVVKDPPYKVVPSRMAVALNSMKILFTLQSPNNKESTVDFWNTLLEEIFPIFATLVDSNRNFEIALGASGFLCLLSSFHRNSNINLFELGESGKTFVDNTLSVLELGYKISDGTAAVAVGQAQSFLYGMLQDEGKSWEDMNRNRRRKTTQQWLTAVARFSQPQDESNFRRWEALVGGTIPLFLQHARNNGTADGMELGRHGLSVLLPLLDQDHFVDDKTKIAAMIALINLLFASHPIMPHHGGKILSYLLGAATLAIEDSPLQKLATFAAGIALVICGPKFTDPILSSILDDSTSYQERLQFTARKIKALSAEIRACGKDPRNYRS